MEHNNCTNRNETGHGGNIHYYSRNKEGHAPLHDFSANINPKGPPSWLRQLISRELENIIHYPDPDCHDLVQAISRKFDISPNQIVPANGTTELLHLIPRCIGCKRAVIPMPSYIDYKKVMELNDIEVIPFYLSPDNGFVIHPDDLTKIIKEGDIVIIGSPNNPTAAVVEAETIKNIAGNHPQSWFVIDEAFLDFVENGNSVACKADNIITLNSLTKFFAIPGLRLGFGTFPGDLAAKLRKILPPWSVNSLAQAVGVAIFKDEQYRAESLTIMRELRDEFYLQLCSFSELHVFPSSVNYFLIQLKNGKDAHTLASLLLKKNIIIRVCGNYDGLDTNYFRIAVRTKEENELFINELASLFSGSRVFATMRKKNRALMIQGTSSNAGKSVIVAALCRILLQDGIRVAPFKAQNMSLNSFVTHNGLEMGRAQVVQAQACRLDPDVRMNPVLLKPNSDMGSQIIVHGKPVGNMSVHQYIAFKNEAKKAACQSYDELAAEYDVVLLEGAGSPGEVNLKNHDIVNMRMAQYADSPVLLVGDIDRGGVYASFVGTMEVLEEWERKLISGFIVNRFRGDATLLQTAHDYVKSHTGRSVIGTIPYIKKLGLPEEDSVSFKEGKLQRPRPGGDHVEIALINLPHISNFTDIEPFLEEPDVYLKITQSISELGSPDAIIIPGSKNVMGDLKFLHESGFADAIKNLAAKNVEIVGICGGYQILGKAVVDPYSIESNNETQEGLHLLDIETVLAPEKTLVCKKGIHMPSGISIDGYEIHHGLSKTILSPIIAFEDGTSCGAADAIFPIWGSYLHGLFDADTFRRWFIDTLRKRKGLPALNTIVASYNLEKSFENLAEIVRRSIDMDRIYSLLKL